MAVPIYAPFSDNILDGAVITSTVAPSSGYPLTIFAGMNPSQRVRFGAVTTTVTFTLGVAAQGDVLVIPMHNLTPGASAVLTLTNGAGFSQVITRPALQVNGFPPTLAVDLTGLAGTRTSTVWNLVIVGNAANVVLGGAVAIYGPKRDLTGVTVTNNFSWDFTERETHNLVETANEYMTPYVQDYGTVSRSIQVSLVGRAAGIATILDWFRGNHGRALPGLLWPDPAVLTGAYFGRWQKTIEMTPMKPFTRNHERSVGLLFEEWPKGQVIG